MIIFYLSRDFQLSIKDPSASESTEGFKIEVYSEILSKYNQVIVSVCFDKKQTKQIPLSFMDGASQEIFISDIYDYELSKSIDVYCICCNSIPPYDDISSNTVEIEIPDQSKDILNSLIDRSITAVASDVTSIKGYAFCECKSLAEVNFPKVTSIGTYAFGYCKALKEVNFPKVTFIDTYAFSNCTGLQYFDMSEVDGIPSISSNTFKSTTCIFLFRDQTQLDEYSNAENWSTLANRFQIKGATT